MSIPKVNIQEANSHLRQLHKKMFELENKIQMQALHVEELQKANHQLQHQLKKVGQESGREIQKKEEEIAELTRRLDESEDHVQRLLASAQERDSTLLKLEKKARLFYEVVEHRPVLSRILEVLDELSVREDTRETVLKEGEEQKEGRKEGEEKGGSGGCGGGESVEVRTATHNTTNGVQSEGNGDGGSIGDESDDTGPEMKVLSTQ